MTHEGDRIRLVHTDDPFTSLRPGDEGVVTNIEMLPPELGAGPADRQVWVEWDNGSSLMLLSSQDRWEVVEVSE